MKITSQLQALPINTSEGQFVAFYSDAGLAAIEFPGSRGVGDLNTTPCCGRGRPQSGGSLRQWHKLTASAIKNVVAGKDPGELPPLDLSSGTTFQQKVWKALLRIGRGKTTTYGVLADQVGSKGASRAVGGACGANPIPLLVPCHRVLAANSRLGGFTAGLDWKRRLLRTEGVAVQ